MNNLLAGALCLALLPTPVSASSDGGVTVSDLKTRCADVGNVGEAFCLGFISGLTDIAIQSGIACPKDQHTYGDTEEMIVGKINARPDLSGQPAGIFVMAMMQAAYPCAGDNRHIGGDQDQPVQKDGI